MIRQMDEKRAAAAAADAEADGPEETSPQMTIAAKEEVCKNDK